MKTFKVKVTILESDDIHEMSFTIQAKDDLIAMRVVNKAMEQLGIKAYDMFLDPITYHVGY